MTHLSVKSGVVVFITFEALFIQFLSFPRLFGLLPASPTLPVNQNKQSFIRLFTHKWLSLYPVTAVPPPPPTTTTTTTTSTTTTAAAAATTTNNNNNNNNNTKYRSHPIAAADAAEGRGSVLSLLLLLLYFNITVFAEIDSKCKNNDILRSSS